MALGISRLRCWLKALMCVVVGWFRKRTRLEKLGVILAVSVLLLALAIYVSLPSPVIRSILQARTESLRMIATNPEIAGIRLGGMRAVADAGVGEAPCLSGMLTPALNTELVILRVDRGPVIIGLGFSNSGAEDTRNVGSLSGADGNRLRFTGPHRFVEDSTCSGTPPTRFPVHGNVEFGRELAPATATREAGQGYLSSGTLWMYVQAIDRILWHISLPTGGLYQVEKIDLPAGSRLRALPEASEPVWWGLARRETDQPGLLVEASTNARQIALVAPGIATGTSIIRVDNFHQITKDPNIFWLIAFGSAVLATLLAGLGKLVEQIFRKMIRSSSVVRPTLQTEETERPATRRTILSFTIGLGMLLVPGTVEKPHAEPVRLSLGGDRFGQGWMFTDARGICRIVTAAHVLERGSALVSPTAIDRHNTELATRNAQMPDPSLDIAFLEALPTRGCPKAGLGETTVDHRLSASPQAFLDFLGLKAAVTVPLTRRARSMDEDGGRIIIFERLGAGQSISQGMSGGAILDNQNIPLAVIIETDPTENRARAVRIDVGATLLRTRIAVEPATKAGAIAGWSVQYGKSLDPARGIDRILGPEPGWSVAPSQKYVTIDIKLVAPRRIGSIALRLDDAAARSGAINVQLSGSGAPGQPPAEWPPLGACAPPPGSTDLFCEFAPRSVAALRLQLRISAPAVSLSHLRLGGLE